MTVVSVLVPYRPDGGHRDRSWAWIERRWRLLFPDYELVVEGAAGTTDPIAFPRAAVLNRAAARATGDVLVLADCDTTCDSGWLRLAVSAVADGRVPWAMAQRYDKLTQESSNEVLCGDPARPLPPYDVAEFTEGTSWSGVTIVPRTGFEEVGGFDERFTKWGPEDVCFGLTLDDLWGRHARLDGAVCHLWHPQDLLEYYGHDRQHEQRQIAERYMAAAWDPAAMRAVRFGT